MEIPVFNFQNIQEAIHEAAETGGSLASGLIKPEFLPLLQAELEQGPFEMAMEETKKVTQKFERYAFLYEPAGMPLLRLLQLQTQDLVRQNAGKYEDLARWAAVDVVVQRYRQDGILTAHKDLARHPYLILSYTITGSCAFEILESRDGAVTKTMRPRAGDLVLLRAPGLKHEIWIDDRPFHRVSGSLDAQSPRISVSFRDNMRPGSIINGFRYNNLK